MVFIGQSPVPQHEVCFNVCHGATTGPIAPSCDQRKDHKKKKKIHGKDNTLFVK